MTTLHSTTLTRSIGVPSGAPQFVQLTSIAAQGTVPAVAIGDLLFIGREAMRVRAFSPDGVTPIVSRSYGGTFGRSHMAGDQVYSGPPWMFKEVDPQGIPSGTPSSNPWINLNNGTIWIAQGDEVGPGTTIRYWQLQTTIRSTGALGVRSVTVSPSL